MADFFGSIRDRVAGRFLEILRKNISTVPTLGKSPFLNYYIDKWFKPFKSGEHTIPVYTGDLSGQDLIFLFSQSLTQGYHYKETFKIGVKR